MDETRPADNGTPAPPAAAVPAPENPGALAVLTSAVQVLQLQVGTMAQLLQLQNAALAERINSVDALGRSMDTRCRHREK